MAKVHKTAIVADGAKIADDVEIGPYSIISANAEIGSGTVIGPHVVIDGYTKIGAGCRIFQFASLGSQTQDLKYKGGITRIEIGDKTTIREYVTVNSGTNDGETTYVGSGCLLMANSHVGHGCKVGNGVIMANSVALAGHVIVQDFAIIGGLSGVHQFVTVGKMCIIGGLTKVTQDTPPFMMIDGNPAAVRGINSVGMGRRGISEQGQAAIKECFKILYMRKLTTTQAVQEIAEKFTGVPEVEQLLSFIKSSERGILK